MCNHEWVTICDCMWKCRKCGMQFGTWFSSATVRLTRERDELKSENARMKIQVQSDEFAKQDWHRRFVALRKQRDALRVDCPTVHRRRCHDCGNEAWHADAVTPYVNCRKCGSQDTRKVKAALAACEEEE